MKISVLDYSGFKAVQTSLGPATKIFYNNASPIDYAVALFSSGSYLTLVPPSGNGPTTAAFLVDFPAAVAVVGLKIAEF